MKLKIGLFIGLALTLTACPPALDDFTAHYDPLINTTVFDAVQGNGYGTNISLCGLGAFSSGVVTVSLENAPVGVSISKPSPLEFNLATACRTNAAGAAPQAIVVTPKDLLIAVAANAPIVSNQNFNFVFQSKNITRKLAATISIKAPPPTQDFTAAYDPSNITTAAFNVNQGSSDGVNVSLCGLGGFSSGNITVSLENAPTGVSLTKPAGNVFTIPTACRAAVGASPQAIIVATKDMFIAVAADAPIVSNQAFNFVFSSSDVVKKLPATISISALPVLTGAK
jgi:predicted aconitase with swiveling domain